MRCTLFALGALPLAARAMNSAVNRAVEPAGVLKFPIKGVQGSSGLSRRQHGQSLPSQQHGLFYTIGLDIGSPGNTVDVQFDTGSSALWVNPVCSKAHVPANCAKFGRLQRSFTLKQLGQSHNITYGKGYAHVEYVCDVVQVGSAKLANQVFGVARDSGFVTTGILGLGPSQKGINNKDGFVVNSLHNQGFTKSIAFGVDLQGVDSARGSVVFGGADLKKFRGALHATPVLDAAASPDGAARYWINLDGISQTAGGKSVTLVGRRLPVFLDTGSTLSYLPPSVVQQLLKGFPGAKRDGYANYLVDCSLRRQDASVDFKFGGTVIRAAYKDFIYPYDANTCSLGFTEAKDKSYLLGDSFLRSAYVVFDQTNRQLALAQADDCGTHLVAIGPGPAGPLVGECGGPPVTGSTTSRTSTKPTSTKTTTSTDTTEAAIKAHPKSHAKSHSVTSSTGTASTSTVTSSTHWGNTSTFTTEMVTWLTTWCSGGEKCPPANTSEAASAPTSEPCPGCNHSTGGVASPTGGLTTVSVPTGSVLGGLPTAPVTAGASRMGAGAFAFIIAAAFRAVSRPLANFRSE
ncbi:hypothetical protein J3458_020844 [Metarhizium acridum]|uniref:uncharacterized protein n=1 Tax=Metarhizium acridum TaxID=92637 RepID=UPI001C6D0918|nr:hypothetical protein J3458_020844 [Metarhizium acridum]